MLEVGTPIPDMTVGDDQGNDVSLRALNGAPFVLYFYPADDTPGCTKEACSFRDNYGAFRDAGVEVFGVSADSAESHVRFRDKYQLPFRLLVDNEHKLADAVGAWGPKTSFGKTSVGMRRVTYVVGADGTIQKVYPEVKPDEHAQQILRDLANA